MFSWTRSEVTPFVSFDYIYLHQQKFSETGAQSLNLHVNATDYAMARTEIGTYLSRCTAPLFFSFKMSYIREDRFQGAHYRAHLTDTDCTFNVRGMNPHRNLFSPGLTLTYTAFAQALQISFSAEAEVGKHYWNQNTSLQGVYHF